MKLVIRAILLLSGVSFLPARGEDAPPEPPPPPLGLQRALLEELKGRKLIISRWVAFENALRRQRDLYLVTLGPQPSYERFTETEEVDEAEPRVSREGRRLLFLTAPARSCHRYHYGRLVLEGADAAVMDLRTKERRVVLRGVHNACFNGDGTQVAASWPAEERQRKGGLRLCDLATGRISLIAPDKYGITDIDWSPDSRWFVFGTRSALGFGNAILTMKADGTCLRPLADFGDSNCHPAFSRDGQMVVFNHGYWGERMYLSPFDPQASSGSGFRGQPAPGSRLLTPNVTCDGNGRWSGDSRYIAFYHKPTDALRVIRVRDGVWTRVTHQNLHLAWWDYDWLPEAGNGEEKPPPPRPPFDLTRIREGEWVKLWLRDGEKVRGIVFSVGDTSLSLRRHGKTWEYQYTAITKLQQDKVTLSAR